MFGIQVKLTALPKALLTATDKGAYKTLKHAALSIRKRAVESMLWSHRPSDAGQPPHAHTGRLRRSIRASEDDEGGWVVGPSYSRVKVGGRPPWLGKLHEFGGTYNVRLEQWGRQKRRRGRPRKGDEVRRRLITYPARPFMQPALYRNLARFHREWQGAIQ